MYAERCLVLFVLGKPLRSVLPRGAALFVVLHPATDPADTGNQQREYTSPDYARTAGFAISEHPDTEILIPQRFWLINGQHRRD